ncbi:hypothetical protein CKK34_5029 [Yarrowia sp. E02]|nr:hypothetical protein CKK34_5029 [Yarrowia sp. E02]
MALYYYMDSLNDDLTFRVQEQFPKTIKEAHIAARKFEAILKDASKGTEKEHKHAELAKDAQDIKEHKGFKEDIAHVDPEQHHKKHEHKEHEHHQHHKHK